MFFSANPQCKMIQLIRQTFNFLLHEDNRFSILSGASENTLKFTLFQNVTSGKWDGFTFRLSATPSSSEWTCKFLHSRNPYSNPKVGDEIEETRQYFCNKKESFSFWVKKLQKTLALREMKPVCSFIISFPESLRSPFEGSRFLHPSLFPVLPFQPGVSFCSFFFFYFLI